MNDMSPGGKGRLHREWTQNAIDLALKGHWREAIRVNESILNLFPRDVEARNRLGKAYFELGQYQAAMEAYRATLEVDPNNTIARKNIRRLESLVAGAAPPTKRSTERIEPQLFLGEIGKTVVTTLQQPAPADVLAGFAAGDPVILRPDKGRLQVVAENGQVLGLIEPGLSRRIINLQKAGNRYVAALTTVNDHEVKVFIREVYRHPSQAGRPSFPVEEEKTPRPYAKRFVRYLEEDEDLLDLALEEEEEEDLDLEIIAEDEVELFEDAEDLVTDDEDLEDVGDE